MLVRKAIQKICKGAYHFIYIYIGRHGIPFGWEQG